MKSVLAICLVLLAFVAGTAAKKEEEYAQLFRAFVRDHNKRYAVEEFYHRYATFKKNVDYIEAFNANNADRLELEVNKLADLTQSEFRAFYLGHVPRQGQESKVPTTITPSKSDEAIDWRAKGAVSAIKNQLHCGSCWSFSTTGAVEGASAIKYGKLLSLSEEQLVDCSHSFGNNGCNGGLAVDAYGYIGSVGGLEEESSYPYTAGTTEKAGTCNANPAKFAKNTNVTGYAAVTAGDESDLMAKLKMGPVSIAVDASQNAFMFYKSGVVGKECGTSIDHAVLLVGADTDSNGKPYWIVKNSWGTDWGQSGYIYIERDNNNCGITNCASVPFV
eukprot:CAMPEP_0113881312 /NCGR_PEP_ID=MMETSP0780_2-20120614/8301_1 /TAXON_ID=652834 /ORGANISM="Palpitomonas bilix" /LENGTH=331 /DNA_ID=CAMNT_0000868145 /DNA_START=142 /DNA_END=1137 /DNA_ORIENTATION=- /assembly_acc=CAM_ASM_000599